MRQENLNSKNVIRELRDAFFDKIYELAKVDKNLIVMSVDMGAMSLEPFKRDFPNQYIHMGIAEQNAIGVAAGLAMGGKKVFVYCITPFITARCLEQIKLDLCYHKLPVTIVGMGTGFLYGSDGPTHYAIDDIALLRTLPEIAIYSPCDEVSTETAAELAYNCKVPSYVRLEKGKHKRIYENSEFHKGFGELSDGSLVLISTGLMTQSALKIVNRLKNVNNINVRLIDITRFPFDIAALKQLLAGEKHIYTLEEHIENGGLGSIIAEIITDQKLNVPLTRFSIPNKVMLEGRSRDEMLKMCGIDEDSVYGGILANVVDR